MRVTGWSPHGAPVGRKLGTLSAPADVLPRQLHAILSAGDILRAVCDVPYMCWPSRPDEAPTSPASSKGSGNEPAAYPPGTPSTPGALHGPGTMRATAVNLSLALLVAAAAACSAGAQPPTVNGRFPSLMVQIHDPPPRPPSLEGPPLSATRREPVSTRAGDAQDESVLPDVEGRYDEDCGPLTWEFRTFDGSCNNKCNIRFGAGNRGVLLHWRPRGDRPTGQDRPSPRAISNIVSRQAEERVPNRRRLSEFLTFFGQFIDHNFVATPSRKDAKQREESMNIPVADDDSSFRSTHNNSRSMTFGRSARATSYGRP
jgi:hypothetical protein